MKIMFIVDLDYDPKKNALSSPVEMIPQLPHDANSRMEILQSAVASILRFLVDYIDQPTAEVLHPK